MLIKIAGKDLSKTVLNHEPCNEEDNKNEEEDGWHMSDPISERSKHRASLLIFWNRRSRKFDNLDYLKIDKTLSKRTIQSVMSN